MCCVCPLQAILLTLRKTWFRRSQATGSCAQGHFCAGVSFCTYLGVLISLSLSLCQSVGRSVGACLPACPLQGNHSRSRSAKRVYAQQGHRQLSVPRATCLSGNVAFALLSVYIARRFFCSTQRKTGLTRNNFCSELFLQFFFPNSRMQLGFNLWCREWCAVGPWGSSPQQLLRLWRAFGLAYEAIPRRSAKHAQ